LRRLRRLASLAISAAATVATATACRSAVDTLGDSPQAARRNADQLFAALEYRFHNVERDPAFAQARLKMGREALVPSRLFGDTTVWPIRSDADSSRTVFVRGGRADARYRFSAGATPLPAANVGDQRHMIRLRFLGGIEYEWTTTIDHAIGSVKPAQVGAAIVATLTAAEGRSGDAAIADAAAAFPNTAKHLAQLFSLDSLRTAVLSSGATDVTLGLTVQAERLRARYPNFATYVAKYVTPSVYRLQISDRSGASYFDLTGRDAHVIVRLRAHHGRLLSRDARGVPLPDSLLLRTDFSAKYKMFRVGYRDLVADFVIEREDHLRAWNLRFRREPAWQLPLAVDKLIRAPLRRPFQGNGIETRLGVRDDGESGAVSFRNVKVTVQESPIMRWIGRLGASAFADFSGTTEAEENRFLSELFAALRADIAALP
jgi:hypothetical protein